MEDGIGIRKIRKGVTNIWMGETWKKRGENAKSADSLLLQKIKSGKQVFAVLQTEPWKFVQLLTAVELQQILSSCGRKSDRLFSENTAQPQAYSAKPFFSFFAFCLIIVLPLFPMLKTYNTIQPWTRCRYFPWRSRGLLTKTTFVYKVLYTTCKNLLFHVNYLHSNPMRRILPWLKKLLFFILWAPEAIAR